jgi:hypothetical protein
MMRSLVYNKYMFLLIAAGCILVSCKKDVLDSRELLVYVGGEYGTTTNAVVVPLVHTPAGILGNRLTGVAVTATREVPADVYVTLAADPSRVASYNEENDMNALPLPSDAYRIVNPGKKRIAAGTVMSDSLQLEITKPELLTNPAGYVLPLHIDEIEGSDRGVRISSNRSTVYIVVTYAFNNIVASESVPAGTIGSRTGWNVQVSNITNQYPATNLTDNNNNTAWRSSNSSTAEKWILVDMGAVSEIKGFQIAPNYVSRSENATGINVLTSDDNINWTEQGKWTGTGPSAASSATAPDLKGITFIGPVQARYFRLDITSRVSGNRVGMAEINVVR